MKILALLLFISFLFNPSNVSAKYNPEERQNNKYGIHIVDPNDIPDAAALVNSSGGTWGYITIVIPENDRDVDKWQQIFDQFRRLHLIPLVRIATKLEGASWTVPSSEEIGEWVKFLTSLNWPIENRYIILFNEPNHAKEWGNTLNPEEYGNLVVEYSKSLRDANEDFFILPAGLDASAPNSTITMDEGMYMERVLRKNPDFFTSIDGWTSHSYPNPGFSASATKKGRGTLTTYIWEISLLKRLGLKRNLPVFITETGWVHSNGSELFNGFMSPEKVGDNLKLSADIVWNDDRIIAVTPFILNYQSSPFDHFSWKKIGSSEYHPHYYAYQSIPKVKGIPRQRESYVFTAPLFPDVLVAESKYTLIGSIKNTGQGILSWQDNYDLSIEAGEYGFSAFSEPLPILEPGQEGSVMVHLQTPKQPGSFLLTATLLHNSDETKLTDKLLTIAPPPGMTIHAQFGWKRESKTTDATVLIYDSRDMLMHKFSGVTVESGKASVSGLTNVIPGSEYRVVMLVPRYLPRQQVSKLNHTTTSISMKRYLPLDLNIDGQFTFSDIRKIFTLSPNSVLTLLFGN